MNDLYIYGTRGDIKETRHRVHFVVSDGKRIVEHSGNSKLVTTTRSVAKPFMVHHQIELCKKNGIVLSDEMLSTMVSSHNGEAVHRKTVEEILKLSNSTVDDLNCGTHLPFYPWLYDEFFGEKDLKRRQLFHNCSGKHAGMLLLASVLNESKSDYWIFNHPVQLLITDSFKELLKILGKDQFSLVLDGCGVPNYSITLEKIAFGYQQLYCNELLQPVTEAVMKAPYMIAGKDRIETDIIINCGFFAKSGSEGVFCVSIPEKKIGIALKVEDGNDDIAEAATVEILSKLGFLSKEQESILDKYWHPKTYTSTGMLSGGLLSEWEN